MGPNHNSLKWWCFTKFFRFNPDPYPTLPVSVAQTQLFLGFQWFNMGCLFFKFFSKLADIDWLQYLTFNLTSRNWFRCNEKEIKLEGPANLQIGESAVKIVGRICARWLKAFYFLNFIFLPLSGRQNFREVPNWSEKLKTEKRSAPFFLPLWKDNFVFTMVMHARHRRAFQFRAYWILKSSSVQDRDQVAFYLTLCRRQWGNSSRAVC